MIIGYHASHEQFAPSELLDYVRAAEDAGFQGIMTSDHIAPWSRRQGNSGNNWAWLGAAMARHFASVRQPRNSRRLAIPSRSPSTSGRHPGRDVPRPSPLDRCWQR